MYKETIDKEGYLIISNLLSSEQINDYKEEVNNYIKNYPTLKNAGGISIPDFISTSHFPKTSSIIYNPKLLEILTDILGTSFRFCSHNDIGINRIVGWHKDKLNGDVAKYETVNIWETHNDEKHEIVKVLIYLQDHSNNNDSLHIVPGSHLNPKIETSGSILLHPKVGDIIIFDQRVTHRGMGKFMGKENRILVSFGFGKNNIFTDNFEKGTIIRQNRQKKI